MSTDDKLEKCFRQGEKGERHKGLRRIEKSEILAKGYLDKAIHNLRAMSDFQRIGYSDWSASAAFYCLYHCLLALLAKEGYESRNQSCTFAIAEKMIEKFSITKEELKEIFDKDVTEGLQHSEKILDIRENIQYSIRTSLEEEEFKRLREKTKRLFDRLRKDIER
ncbi:MAG: HEPN domain-containing protein [Candidatus Woesearchaeota archaeon]